MGMTLLALLPITGYLLGDADVRPLAMALLLLSVILTVTFELLVRSQEHSATLLQHEIEVDEAALEDWKEKIRLLEGVVKILRADTADLKRGVLVGEIAPDPHPSPHLQLAAPDTSATEVRATPEFSTEGRS